MLHTLSYFFAGGTPLATFPFCASDRMNCTHLAPGSMPYIFFERFFRGKAAFTAHQIYALGPRLYPLTYFSKIFQKRFLKKALCKPIEFLRCKRK